MHLVGRLFGVVPEVGRAAALLLGAGLLSGCGARYAEAACASDFKCDTALATPTGAPHRYVVTGCGHRATYVCVGNSEAVCAIQTAQRDDEPDSGSSDEAEAEPAPERPRRRPKPVASEVQVENKGDDAVMVLELVLDGKALLRVTAMPDKRADVVQLKLVRREPDEHADACKMDWMINGQVMATPEAVATRKGEVLSHRVQFKRELIAELGTAEQIALRVCRTRWALTREQLFKMHEFVERFHEELAWQQPPRDGSTGGMTAPTGGWPNWSAVATSLPTKVEGVALDGRELFKKLSPSVFLLVAARPEGTAQGSAVAVSPTELVTNCHVVQGALKLTLKQAEQEWPASLVRADPASDRCVVSATGVKLQPVAGVRAYGSLEVGEPAYTLGSPVGLELTLGSGIVSGRRDEQDRHYIQTTAPISPGSSGGGLFDARGNLIGVTTLVLAGRERLNQSLNFAIPIDAFYAQ
jgi:S1-C subfamily serine protease